MVSEKSGISKDRIWIDGCFDFAHHGHAGAMLQARQLGNSLYVGVHSDEEILENKGPVVMTLPERVLAVEACKWATKAVPGAPYVTDPAVMDEWGCFYVVHGDDITTDANGEDCYRVVKEAGRFLIVKRTPNISTTDLVGRMLLCTKNHHIPTVKETSEEVESRAAHIIGHTSQDLKGAGDEAGLITRQNLDKFNTYATSEDGRSARDGVYIYAGDSQPATLIKPDEGFMKKQRKMIYVDGGFDLFFAGHIEFLRLVSEASKSIANELGEDVGIVVGIHDDATVNKFKGLNYPIMNLFERALCVLQCKYVSHIVLQAPYSPSKHFIESLPWDIIRVMHGPTDFTASTMTDPYSEAKAFGLYQEIANHQYSSISTETIVERVTRNRGVYEERQRRKGWKAEVESKLRQAESQ